jgi:amino acid adenylation domain-containing protein
MEQGPAKGTPEIVGVHRLFAAQAAGQPAADAVVIEENRLTYGELETRANQLAWALIRRGVKREQPVAVLMERSPELIIAMLAVLKSGGVYVPLDLNSPAERLVWQIADCRSTMVLGKRAQSERLTGLGLRFLAIDEAGSWIEDHKGSPCVPVTPENLAYIIYTSGSTGVPKGVGVPHRGLWNLTAWHCQTYRITSQDRATLIACPAFDASLWEIWPYLASGASLYIPDEETRRSPALLGPWLVSKEITISFLPTPLAEAILMEPWPNCAALRTILTGGDVLRRRPASGMPFRLMNHYGPTECSVVTTFSEIHVEDPSGHLPAIGRPIDNVRTYVLDMGMKRVPIGVVGELYVGGAGIAHGYLGQPKLTAEKFLPDPFSGVGERMYRTGDRVRMRENGDLEFVGRIDKQVKVRGFRIELGEVEHTLLQHPDVRQAAVVASEDRAGGTRIVAYVVGAEKNNLRTWLREKLPSYLVPAVIVPIDSLPVTANGKLDRDSLPLAFDSGQDAGSESPSSDVERVVATIWREVLDVPRVGRDDNFFDLGGHSLMVTRVVGRVRDRLLVELPFRSLFEFPTLRGFSEQIERSNPSPSALSNRPLLSRAESRKRFPLSFQQEWLWRFQEEHPQSALYNVQQCFLLKGPVRPDVLESALAAVIWRHEILRTNLCLQGNTPVQTVRSDDPPDCLLKNDLRGQPAQTRLLELQRLAQQDSSTPFNLADGPLQCVRLIHLADDEHALLFTRHHIISDGWSVAVMFREWGLLYNSILEGTPIDLPDLPVQYGDYAAWQRQWLQGGRLERELKWWEIHLQDAPLLHLPGPPRGPSIRSPRWETSLLSTGLTEVIHQLCRTENFTPFMVFLAGFLVALNHWSNATDIVVGTDIAGRTKPELEALIGFFANTLAFRVRFQDDPTFRVLLDRVRTITTDGYEHQDAPFELLVERIRRGQIDEIPRPFQVMLLLQNMPKATLDLAGIDVRLLRLGQWVPIVKFDLELVVTLQDGQFKCVIGHDKARFKESVITAFARCLEYALECGISNPNRSISELGFPTAAAHFRL